MPTTSPPDALAPPRARLRPGHTTVAAKALMAGSAIVLTGYMLLHVLGNLLIFLGPRWINGYGALLHATGPLLWAARLVLLGALVVHVAVAFRLRLDARRARPRTYARLVPRASTLASRTMGRTGVTLLLFAAYHTPQMTAGWWHPRFAAGDDYGNVVWLFATGGQYVEYVVYTAGLGALALHMYHGTWSVLRTLGVPLPARGAPRRYLTTAYTALVVVGFAGIVFAVAVGALGAPAR